MIHYGGKDIEQTTMSEVPHAEDPHDSHLHKADYIVIFCAVITVIGIIVSAWLSNRRRS